MRTPLSSPFSPGADSIPQVWAGRVPQLSDWHDVVRPRRLAGLPERGRVVLGESGSGKSSLVRRIAAEAEDNGDWATPQLRVPTGSDPLKLLASALLELADRAGLGIARDRRIGDLLKRVEAVAASGLSISLREGSGAEPHVVLTGLLVELGRASLSGGNVTHIHLDEVQNIEDGHARSQLLIALGDALAHEEDVSVPGGGQVRRALPISVYLSGLPEFSEMAGSLSGATFSRRFHSTTLGALDDADLDLALSPFVLDGWEIAGDEGMERVRMEPEAARFIVELTCGEPYLFQLAGEGAWFASVDNVITAEHVRAGWRQREAEAEMHVARVLERLPERERNFVEAMAALAPQDRTAANIARNLGYERSSDIGTTSRRLDLVRGIIERGTTYSFRHRAVGAYLTSSWPRV